MESIPSNPTFREGIKAFMVLRSRPFPQKRENFLCDLKAQDFILSNYFLFREKDLVFQGLETKAALLSKYQKFQ